MLATDYEKSHLSHLPRIVIETIPKDPKFTSMWEWMANGDLSIKVSESNAKYEFLSALHSLVEGMLCNMKGINTSDVDEFNTKFELMRSEFPLLVGEAESGDNDAAPHHHEHQMASRIEHWLSDSTGVDWEEYRKS